MMTELIFEKCFKSIGEKDVAKDFNQEIDN